MYFIFQIILLKHKLQTTQNIMAKHNGYSPFQVLHGKAGGPHKAGALLIRLHLFILAQVTNKPKH